MKNKRFYHILSLIAKVITLSLEQGVRRASFCFLLFTLSLITLPTQAQVDEDSVSAAFFREYYHQGHLAHWLDGLSDHTIYQGLHVGQWDESGQLIFTVDGNSFRWNRYYLDGFRVDNRFTAGSTSYVPNMENYNLRLDPLSSVFHFEQDTLAGDYAQASWNRGNLGGISWGTADIIHLSHATPREEAYDQDIVLNRQYVRGQGTVDVAATLRDRQGRGYRQHLYASMGQQAYPNLDHNGLRRTQPLYTASYYKVQADGQLPSGGFFDRFGYLLNFSGKDNYGAEFYYNPNEVMRLNTYSASLYAKRGGLTTGLTWATNVTRHDDLQFSRNFIDQDGESLEPWMTDGNTHELSWHIAYARPLLSWLQLKAEGYNSLLLFSPSAQHFTNEVYLQHAQQPEPTPLYRYEWTSRAFAAGLLENKVGVEARYQITPKLEVRGDCYFTLDGMVLRDRTKISPNVKATAMLDYRPTKWLQLGLTLAHDRVSYNIEDIRFMSRDYMSANVFFSGTDRLFTTTGGSSHRYAAGLQQPAYATLSVPIHLRFGRHEFALLQSFRKYYHVWMTRFADGAAANGVMNGDYYFMTPGARDYIVDYQPTGLMSNNWLTNTPYFMTQTTRYTYHGRKVFFSLSWQSMMGASVVALGIGPAANNIGVLSESTANPNTRSTLGNTSAPYPGVGRLDQDKAYVCRIYLAYNVCKNFRFGINGRWTDGQPIVFFNTANSIDVNGNLQVAVRPGCSRGINPTDGDFGCRECALFNFDLHAQANWKVGKYPMTFSLMCYNIYDFGTSLTEYSFPQGLRGVDRRGYTMTLTIPRGIIGTLKIGL